MAWNLSTLGDALGVAKKTADLGWRPHSIGEMLQHPLFTLGGAFTFLSELTYSFWRGEITWYFKVITHPLLDSLCWWTSALTITRWTSRWCSRPRATAGRWIR